MFAREQIFKNTQNWIHRILHSQRRKLRSTKHHKVDNNAPAARSSNPPYIKIGLSAALTSILAYDGIVNEFAISGATIRFMRSLKTASLIAIDYALIERKKDTENYEELLRVVHKNSANRLLEMCLLNGGLYIKVGQGVAAINHILPKEYTDTMSLLQDKCLPTSRKEVEEVFVEDFGRRPDEIFMEFNYKPAAAASLAQVFKAKLKSGEDVAVKVQYRDLRKRFHSDLGTLIFLQNIIELFFKNYNFGWILRDLQKNLIQELNFIKEANNSERCANDLKNLDYVHIPKVYWNFTKERVLTIEWIEGFKISDVDQIKRNKINLKEIDIKLYKMFAEQIFNTGFVHADPHSGNILVHQNSSTGKVTLVLLDHGLYEELPEHIRLPLCQFWEATVLKDEKKMEAAARKLSITDYAKFAEVLFQQPIRIHKGKLKTKLTEKDIAYMQKMAKRNFDIIMKTLREMPKNMLFVVRNLNTIRAIGRLHGDVVDRHRLMARYAQHCIYNKYNTVFGNLLWLYRRIVFEYCLWRSAFTFPCLNMYINILHKLGRAPSSAKNLLSDLEHQNIS